MKLVRWILALIAVAGAAVSCGSEQETRGTFDLPASDASTPDAAGMPTTPGETAAPGETAPPGSCDPTFCPSVAGGAPCCVSANGPCGVDMGTGCISTGSSAGDGG